MIHKREVYLGYNKRQTVNGKYVRYKLELQYLGYLICSCIPVCFYLIWLINPDSIFTSAFQDFGDVELNKY